jgi:SAM-dependent methyltransferase
VVGRGWFAGAGRPGLVAEQHAAFVGSVPPNYDRYLGPLLFHPYADDLAARLPVAPGTRVLEVACGTGIVTERLVRRLAGQGTLVATDLNDAMIAHARARIPDDPALEWRQADGASLPFPDRAFDVVVCEFGLMFFPDKAAGVREAFRVLGPGGRYLFNVWDAIEGNAVARIAHDTIRTFFPDDPPLFYQTPFNLQDTAAVRSLLDAAGFVDVAWETVEKVGTSPSAADAATGLVEGNPVIGTIMARRPDALPDIRAAVARTIAAELGDHPVRTPLRAHVFTARRPGSQSQGLTPCLAVGV